MSFPTMPIHIAGVTFHFPMNCQTLRPWGPIPLYTDPNHFVAKVVSCIPFYPILSHSIIQQNPMKYPHISWWILLSPCFCSNMPNISWHPPQGLVNVLFSEKFEHQNNMLYLLMNNPQDLDYVKEKQAFPCSSHTGHNGAGKTTLMKEIAAHRIVGMPPDRGMVRIFAW